MAGVAYGRREPGASVAFGILSVYLMIVTLADVYTTGLHLVIVGSILFMALSLGRLMARLAPAEEDSGVDKTATKDGDSHEERDDTRREEQDGGEDF